MSRNFALLLQNRLEKLEGDIEEKSVANRSERQVASHSEDESTYASETQLEE